MEFCRILALLFLLESSAWAVEPTVVPAVSSCDRLYRGMGYIGRRWGDAKAHLEKLKGDKVNSIFPDVAHVPNGSGGIDDVVRLTPANTYAFHAHFDDFMKSQTRAGRIPAREVKYWREWLATQPGSTGGYPSLATLKKTLLERYVKNGSTLQEFYDDQFLQYVLATKAVTPATLEEYVASLDLSARAVLVQAAKRRWEVVRISVGAGVRFAFYTAPVMLLANKAIIEPATNIMVSQVLSWRDWAVRQGSLLTDRASLVFNPKEQANLQTAGQKLDLLVTGWSLKQYNDMGQEMAVKEFQGMEHSIRTNLSTFYSRMNKIDQNFNARWNGKLKEDQTQLSTKLNSHRDIKKELDELRKKMEELSTKGKPANEEDQAKMLQLQKDLDLAEGEIAGLLSGYQLYKYAHPYTTLLPAELESYENAYKQYIERMNLDKLRLRTLEKLREHVALIDKSGLVSALVTLPVLRATPGHATP